MQYKVISYEELERILENGQVKLRIDGKMEQYTRDLFTADTCNCEPGMKECSFISELDFRDMMKTWDRPDDKRIGVWDIGTHKFTSIQATQVQEIIGGQAVEDEESSCCCKEI